MEIRSPKHRDLFGWTAKYAEFGLAFILQSVNKVLVHTRFESYTRTELKVSVDSNVVNSRSIGQTMRWTDEALFPSRLVPRCDSN